MPKINQDLFTLKNSAILTIRSLSQGDEEASRIFAVEVAKESKNTLKYDGMPLLSVEKLKELFAEYDQHPTNLYFGAFYGNELVASLRFFQRNINHPWIKHVGAFGMAVREPYWGQGIGSKLLQIMISEAKDKGIIRIEAEVRANNENGIRLYQKNGFKIEGRREKAAFIDGVFEDEFYIARCL